MSQDTLETKSTALVPVDPHTDVLVVKTEKPDKQDEVRQETEALIRAVQQRMQAEAEAMGDRTREAYLMAIRQMRSAIEQEPVMGQKSTGLSTDLSPEKLQKQAEKSWLVIAQELESLGFRLVDVARTAWKTFKV